MHREHALDIAFHAGMGYEEAKEMEPLKLMTEAEFYSAMRAIETEIFSAYWEEEQQD